MQQSTVTSTSKGDMKNVLQASTKGFGQEGGNPDTSFFVKQVDKKVATFTGYDL